MAIKNAWICFGLIVYTKIRGRWREWNRIILDEKRWFRKRKLRFCLPWLYRWLFDNNIFGLTWSWRLFLAHCSVDNHRISIPGEISGRWRTAHASDWSPSHDRRTLGSSTEVGKINRDDRRHSSIHMALQLNCQETQDSVLHKMQVACNDVPDRLSYYYYTWNSF